jgi:hypothetical protein
MRGRLGFLASLVSIINGMRDDLLFKNGVGFYKDFYCLCDTIRK